MLLLIINKLLDGQEGFEGDIYACIDRFMINNAGAANNSAELYIEHHIMILVNKRRNVTLLSSCFSGKCSEACENCLAGSSQEKRNEILRFEENRAWCPPAFPR